MTEPEDRPEGIAEKIAGMYGSPLQATRTGPLYNAFSYPTKISPEAIALFIATHSHVGATIADVFSGSGTTGVAAILCERPTKKMIHDARRLGVDPRWGPRVAHLFDVGVLGTFIGRVLTSPPEPHAFRMAVAKLIEAAKDKLGSSYEAIDPEGRTGSIRHVIWSDLIKCQSCSAEHRLWDVAVERDPARFVKQFTCERCGTEQNVDNCRRVEREITDVFGRPQRTRARVPVEVHGATGTHKWVRPAVDSDIASAERATRTPLPASAPDAQITWGELYRSGYHSGVSHLHHFYTPRNFMAIATCMELAGQWPEPMRSALQFLVLSYNASHSTLMTRIVAKRDQRDFVLTGAQSGVLYVSGLPVEKNVLAGLARKAGTIAQAFELTHGAATRVHVHNCSSESLPLRAGSVDYVFTDPPFGDYIPYGEINQINELWLGLTTNLAAETVVSGTGGKDVDHYERSMSAIFVEVGRVLKPEGLVTVVFHSAHARIWRALTGAFATAKLRVRGTSVLDKVQASFKQVVSTISVKGDPLILLDKTPFEVAKTDHDDIVTSVIELARRTKQPDLRALFSSYAAACLAAGHPVELDAAAFDQRLNDALKIAA